MLPTHQSTARPVGQRTATSLAIALVKYLTPETQSRVYTTDRAEHDCVCNTVQVEVVIFSDIGHTHIEIHCPPARQTVFLHTMNGPIIQYIKAWCQEQDLDYCEKRS